MKTIHNVLWHAGDEYQMIVSSENNIYVPISYPRNKEINIFELRRHMLSYSDHFSETDSFNLNGILIEGYEKLVDYVERNLI